MEKGTSLYGGGKSMLSRTDKRPPACFKKKSIPRRRERVAQEKAKRGVKMTPPHKRRVLAVAAKTL